MPTRRSRSAFTLVELLVVIAIIGILVGLLLPAVQAARGAARRMQCSSNLRQIGLAMHNYADAFKGLPPRRTWASPNWYQGSVNGWGVKILPYLEQINLYEQYEMEVGFFEAINQPVVRKHMSIYECPSSPANHLIEALPIPPSWQADASRQGAVGDYWSFYGYFDPVHYPQQPRQPGALQDNRAQSFGELLDGTSNTLLLAEKAGRPEWWINGKKQPAIPPNQYSSFHWTGAWASYQGFWVRGYSLDGQQSYGTCAVNCNNDLGIYGFHEGGALALRADGSVTMLNKTLDLHVLYALVSRAGGEVAMHE